MFATSLNRICAVVQLRNSIRDICLVGCVGEENAGKTTMVRALLGLDAITDGYLTKNATICPVVSPLRIHTSSGLRAVQDSPMLVDTPGMFDARQELGDCAIKHLGGSVQFATCLDASSFQVTVAKSLVRWS